MHAPDPARDRRRRRTLVGLAVLFFAPVLVAFYLYYGHHDWRPVGRVNHGELVDPARPLPAIALPRLAGGLADPAWLQGRWTLLTVGTGECAERCRHDLYETRQVRIALDRDMDRVQRVLIAVGPCCDLAFLQREHPDLIALRATPEAQPLLGQLPGVDAAAPDAASGDRIYLVDPLGNLMMSYAPDANPKGLLEDLKRLLRLSHVG